MTSQTSIRYLKGVGDKRASLYHKLGVETVGDLLHHFPRSYIDLSNPHTIRDAPYQEPCAVKALLTRIGKEQRIRKGLSLWKLRAEDETGTPLDITLFNVKYTVEQLVPDRYYIFYGHVTGTLLRREMSAPEIYPADGGQPILPVYPLTAGLTTRMLRCHMAQALRELKNLPDPLPEHLRRELDLPELNRALRDIHFPQDLGQATQARRRFIFQELLVLCCALGSLRSQKTQAIISPMHPVDLQPFYDSLPFSPTGAQKRCIAECAADLIRDVPMNRLIQGDVGSGKTLIAAACAYILSKNGRQTAMMVPTEILAEQHLVTMSRFLEPLGLKVELLTGSTKAAQRRKVLDALALGQIDLLIGTHALLSEGVEFFDLGLVITDEQHRFGVKQRATLSQKGKDCHVLVMSATPIPRTLSLIIYGDLSLSILDEKPPGRQPVETVLIDSSKRTRAMGFIRKHLDEGKQAYIVCPLIEQGEMNTELRSAVEYARNLSERELKGYRVGLLHGRMSPREKDSVMRRFKSGELQVLVSTTVVEVGVDVPGATIIMIENAERFGLSQLHQLRGRVGRAQEKSWCILVSDVKSGKTAQRLQVMKREHDGFAIAEQDLALRGPGDFFGYRQHGLPALKVADLADDMELMEQARQAALRLLEKDPALEQPEHALLRAERDAMLSAVGDRPN